MDEDQLCLDSVAYWPWPSCQKKKSTCVNNRCIRSKISGDQGQPWLLRGWIEWEIVTLAGSRWVSNYYITPATGSSDQLERRCWNESHVPAEAWPQAPGWAAQENGKEILLWPEEWGSICCSSVQSPTHLSHTTLSIKIEVYFSKELCPLVFIASLWFCIWVYNNSNTWNHLTVCKQIIDIK